MIRSDWRYIIELFAEDGAPLGPVPLPVDWEPARQWTWWRGVRDGGLPPADAGTEAFVEPLWHPDLGAPYLRGFRMRLAAADGSGGAVQPVSEFPKGYFGELTRRAVRALVDEGRLAEGATVRYRVLAYPAEALPGGEPAPRLKIETIATPLPIIAHPIGAFLEGATAFGPEDAEDMPVFFSPLVVSEAESLARAAGGRETGGILLGNLYRDPGTRQVFCHVTAQIPAHHTVAETARLTFTPATWAAVRGAVTLRARHEVWMGWLHFHPLEALPCRKCPPERRRVCPAAEGFLSPDDRVLHRTVFPRAFSLAMVLTEAGTGDLRRTLFGWRRGLLARRGFHLLREAVQVPAGAPHLPRQE